MELRLKNGMLFTEWLHSEEGEEETRKFVEKIKAREQHKQRWVQRIRTYYGNREHVLIERILDKYDSQAYYEREVRRMHREPEEALLWILLEYAIVYGREVTHNDPEAKYANTFTAALYVIDGYAIQCMHGQGSVVRIDKIE